MAPAPLVDQWVVPADMDAGLEIEMFPDPGTPGSNQPPVPYVDVSLEPPSVQFQALAAILQANDMANPAPFTGTPPWGEPTDPDLYLSDEYLAEQYIPPADLDSMAEADVQSVFSDAFPPEFPAPTWWLDPQYHGLGVPPGPPNLAQPVESGHTQITLPNPSAEQGWDAWSGRTPMARVARMENSNPYYNAGIQRGHGPAPIKLTMPYVLLTQQYRDMLLAQLKKRGVHNVLVSDVPSVPYTEQVTAVDPTVYNTAGGDIGPEGVMPW